MTLLELCSDFGIEESRGTLLRVPFSHQDFADLVGATRSRVTEHLAVLEREHLVIRQGRQLVCAPVGSGRPSSPHRAQNGGAFIKPSLQAHSRRKESFSGSAFARAGGFLQAHHT